MARLMSDDNFVEGMLSEGGGVGPKLPPPPLTSSPSDVIELQVTVPVMVHRDARPADVLAALLAAAATAADTAEARLVHNGITLDPECPVATAGVSSGAGVQLTQCNDADPPPELNRARDRLRDIYVLHLGALKESLGPKFIEKEDTAVQLRERTERLEAVSSQLSSLDGTAYPCSPEDSRNFLTKMQHDLRELERQRAIQETEFWLAVERYRISQRRAVRRSAMEAQRKSEAFAALLEAQPSEALARLAETVESAVNTGPLEPRSEVTVPYGGAFVQAVVDAPASTLGGATATASPSSADEWTVLVETEVTTIDRPYSRGFSNPATFHRTQVYANQPPLRQPDPGPTAAALATETGRDLGIDPLTTSDPEYLAELMAKADAVHPLLCRDLVRAVSAAGLMANGKVSVLPGPPKRPARIAQKAAGKYNGDFARVLDFARVTLACVDVETIAEAFRAVISIPEFRVLRAKNRLHPAHDPAASAGYRDVLVNLEHTATGVICEVQLTLREFLLAKRDGGHAVYQVLRLIGRLEPGSNEHQGDGRQPDTLTRLADGAFAKWDGSGTSAEVVTTRLVPALQSPHCFLRVLVLNAVAGLRSLQDEMLTEAVLAQLAPSLEVLEARVCGAAGSIPVGLRCCTRLTRLHLGFNRLSEEIPGWIGDLKRLRYLHLGGNCLTGSIPGALLNLTQLRELRLYSNRLERELPQDIGRLRLLTHLELHDNLLSGAIPASIGDLTELRELFLSENTLSGQIPGSIGRLSKLTDLYLYTNELTGNIPREVGQLAAATAIDLSENQLTGSIPEEFGLLERLGSLMLEKNRLSGEVPSSLGGLRWLAKLQVQGNQLSVPVPTAIRERGTVVEE
eukprot:m.469548 g.469548  ORF g.469548 m.469548 type:complete len:857 (+) comp28696_c0_seq1:148-2718(+)